MTPPRATPPSKPPTAEPVTAEPVTAEPVTVEPLTPQRWPDLCALFGPNGANSGCWCMWWRVTASQWTAGAGSGSAINRVALEDVIEAGEPTGVLGYSGSTPVGWCAVAPRSAYPRILRSPTLRPADLDEPAVWSVTCFFINRHHRRGGLGKRLLDAAVGYAAGNGAHVVEGYPVDTRGVRRPSGDLFTGTVNLFQRAGFTEYARPASGLRIVMRRVV